MLYFRNPGTGALTAILPSLALDTEKKRDVRETARQVNAVLVPLVPKLPMEANVPLDQDDESR